MGAARWILVAALAVGCGGAEKEKPKDKDWTTMEYHWAPQDQPRARNLVPTASENENVLLTGATVLTAVGEPIENGWVWLKDGKIAAVSATKIDAPGAQRIDVAGKFVTPGLIDTHSHLGVYPTPYAEAHSDGNEATSPATPDVDAVHSVWPQDPGFQAALRGGITSMQILPGSANLVGGNGVTVQLHPGISSRSMLFPDAPKGLKMACGENPKRVYGSRGGAPSTRMGNMAVWRKTFLAAKVYQKGVNDHVEAMKRWMAAAEQKPEAKPKPPPRDIGLETLVSAMEGKTLVHVHCYRADEMTQVLELGEEFGFQVRSFHHAVEAYKIRDLLARWDVSVSTWADWWGFKLEAHDAVMENAALVDEAGGRAIIHSDSSIGVQRLNQEASKAYQAGIRSGVDISELDALRWITINPAWALGVDSQTGTLEVGKRADVVVWDHHPFSIYAKAQLVFVEGVREFDVSRKDEPWSDFETGQAPRGGVR
jgi:imidazolonepropionase-like amidohydrolase